MSFIKIIIVLIIVSFLSINHNLVADSAIFVNELNDAIVLSENLNKDILIIFSADWCGYCNKMKKDIDNNTMLLDNYIVCFIDCENNNELIRKYRVKNIPHSLIIKDKQEIRKKIGYSNLSDFKKWLHYNE